MTWLLPSAAARLRALLHRRGVLAAALVAAAAGVILTRLPLLEIPGYELAEALTLLLAVLGGPAAIAAIRLERRAGEPAFPSPPAASPGRAVLSAWAASVAFALAALLPAVVAAVAGAAFTTRCDPFAGAGFMVLLPLPSALLASAAGVLAGAATRRAWTALLLYFGLLLASLGISLWPVWAGPQIFALNHLAGYFPGPLYDEALPLDARLVAYRALTVVWTALVLLVTAALLDLPSARLRLWRPRLGQHLALLALALALLAAEVFHFELGLRTDRADLEAVLGGRRETPHFVLHFPRGKPVDDVDRLARDLEFDFERVTTALGSTPPGPVHAWFHAGPDEKRRHLGAANTNFAKPWLLELHVHDEPFPHPVARHELAHVVAGSFGSPLFRASARWVFAINAGIVEGLAVAADESRNDELTLHQWAAAMRKLKLAPDVRSIVGPAGFYTQAQSRAYTLAGSFLRWLVETRGAAALHALYPAGEFEDAYGTSLDALAAEWERFLDAVPLSERALHIAQVRFERGSLFARPCAREVALLEREANELAAGDPERALKLFRRCADLEPGNLGYVRGQAEVLRARERLAEARALWEATLAREDLSPGERAQATMALGDVAWQQGDAAEARARFEAVLALHRDRGTDRTAAVKLQAVASAQASAPVLRFFERADLPQVLGVAELALADEGTGSWRYLVGRQLLQRGDPRGASRHLLAARAQGLPSPELGIESLRMLAQAAYLSGDCSAAREVLGELEREGDDVDRAWAADWKARCVFEERVFGGPIPTE